MITLLLIHENFFCIKDIDFLCYVYSYISRFLFTLNIIWLYILKLKHDSNSVVLYFKIHLFIDLNEKNYNIETKQAASFIY